MPICLIYNEPGATATLGLDKEPGATATLGLDRGDTPTQVVIIQEQLANQADNSPPGQRTAHQGREQPTRADNSPPGQSWVGERLRETLSLLVSHWWI